MNSAPKCMVAAAFALIVFASASAKDWRGLVPLGSTRDDVVQLMGEWQWAPVGRTTIYEPLTDSDPYYLADGEVYFSYAPRIDERRDALPREIEPGVLLSVRLTPFKPLEWSQLPIDRAAFHSLDQTPSADDVQKLADVNDGLIVWVKDGKIVELMYLPRGEDRAPYAQYFDQLQSQDRSTALASVARVGSDIVETAESSTLQAPPLGSVEPDQNEPNGTEGDNNLQRGVTVCLSFESEPRLDLFAIELSKDPTARGYVVVYEADHDNTSEAQQETDNALNYLKNERGIDPGRLFVIHGGRSSRTFIELWLVPLGSEPPTLAPSNGRGDGQYRFID